MFGSIPRFRSEPNTVGPFAVSIGSALFCLASLLPIASRAAAGEAVGSGWAAHTEEPVWSLATPIGPVDYRAGRGVRLGRTGLNIGGFSTFEASRVEGEPGEFAFEGVNFLVLFEPVERLQAFAEIEVGPIFEADTDEGDLHAETRVEVERLYADLRVNDRLNLRFGKFLTPIGRWNQVPAEPFVWTATEPAMVEGTFDETQSGAMVSGSLYPADHILTYRLYSQFLDPIDDDGDLPPADHSLGGRIEYGGALGEWSFGLSLLVSELDEDRNYLGGVDGEWHRGPLELTAELIISDGEIEDRDLWGAYLQGAYEILPRLHLVGRYEHFDRFGSESAMNLGDLGVAWIPRPYLHLKATYRFVDRETDEVARGVTASFSVLF